MSSDGQQPCPPINNLLQPDQYNRLDAQAIEKTRVVNTQLDQRLRAQQTLLAKYRLAAERFHKQEKERVRNELIHLTSKQLPAGRSKVLRYRERLLLNTKPSSASASESRARKATRGGAQEDRCNHPFCRRFFIHHLPSKKKFYKIRTPTPTTPTSPFLLDAGRGGSGGGGCGGGGGGGCVSRMYAGNLDDRSSGRLRKVAVHGVQRVTQTYPNGGYRSPGVDCFAPHRELELTTDHANLDMKQMSSRDSRNAKNGNCSPRSKKQRGRTGQEVT